MSSIRSHAHSKGRRIVAQHFQCWVSCAERFSPARDDAMPGVVVFAFILDNAGIFLLRV
jgi:hypothetical protein